MKVKGESGRDGVEVDVNPGFATTLENIDLNAIGSGNGEDF
jgi:hypothetical protein